MLMRKLWKPLLWSIQRILFSSSFSVSKSNYLQFSCWSSLLWSSCPPCSVDFFSKFCQPIYVAVEVTCACCAWVEQSKVEVHTCIVHEPGLLIGCNKKGKLCEILRADYAIRKANYAINNVNCAIFSEQF